MDNRQVGICRALIVARMCEHDHDLQLSAECAEFGWCCSKESTHRNRALIVNYVFILQNASLVTLLDDAALHIRA